MKLNLIMPMGGGGTRFLGFGFESPKPLIEIHGKPFFYWATQSIVKFVDVESLTFVVLQDHVDRFGIDKRIREYYPDAAIRVIPEVLPGAVLTCMEGLKEIDNNDAVLFNDCDHLFLCDALYDYIKAISEGKPDTEILDGALLTFHSEDPRFSFVESDAEGYVTRTVEKEAISTHAVCGAYLFKDRKTFEDAVSVYLENCAYKEYFVSGVYNVLAGRGGKIRHFEVDAHDSFGTPEEYEVAKASDTYRKLTD